MQNSPSGSSVESSGTDQTIDALRELIIEQAKDLATTRIELIALTMRLDDVAAPVISLSPETTRRIAQAVSELGIEAADAVAATISESTTVTTKLLAELVTELVTEEAKRALDGDQGDNSSHDSTDHSIGSPAGAVAADASSGVVTARAGLVEQPREPAPAPAQTAAAPPAKDMDNYTVSDLASATVSDLAGDDTVEPLTLDSLDDPFLEALIRHKELSR